MKSGRYWKNYWKQFELDLRMKYQFHYPEEEMKQLMSALNFPLIEKQRAEKSVITETALQQVQTIQKLYEDFMGLLRNYNCDITWLDNQSEYTFNTGYSFMDFNFMSKFDTALNIGKVYFKETMSRYFVDISWEDTDFYGKTITKYSKSLFANETILELHNRIVTACRQLEQQYYGHAKGDAGEEYVAKELDLFKDKYKFARNIKFRYEDLKGMTSETDLYVMTAKGLLVCEIKNKGNEKYTFKISRDGQWSKYGNNGNFLSVEDSPFAQNTRHCIATEKLLGNNGIADCKILPVVIIGNEMVRIENDSENVVIRPSEIYNYVERMNLPERYDEQYQNKVISILNENNVEEENLFDVDAVPDGTYQYVMGFASKLMEFIQSIQKFDYDVKQYCMDKDNEAEIIKKKREKPLKIARVLAILLFVLVAVLWIKANWSWIPGMIIIGLIIYGYVKLG